MVPWYLLVIAGEIGIFIGFVIAAFIALFQIRRFNKNISLYTLPQKRTIELFTAPMKNINDFPAEEEKN